MIGVVEMIIGYTDEMHDSDVACLGDWADYHAKKMSNPTWKRAYALIREGTDLLLRRRALGRTEETEEQNEPLGFCKTQYRVLHTRTPGCVNWTAKSFTGERDAKIYGCI